MQHLESVKLFDQQRALWASTFGFTACFAIWTIFSIIGIKIKQELGLNETEFGVLVATPILIRSLSRICFDAWIDRFDGMYAFTGAIFFSAVTVSLLSSVDTYLMLPASALGAAWISKWFDIARWGTGLHVRISGVCFAAFRHKAQRSPAAKVAELSLPASMENRA